MTSTPMRRGARPQPRGRITRLGDRAVGRLLRLPPATTEYTVTREIAVPMRDGVELRADHYAPRTDRPAATILVRGPYGRTGPASIIAARPYAERGYHVVLQSTRGTFGSGGVFDPGKHEVDDGADTMAWLRRQPWFTGRLATIGASYLGFTQWALLADPPPELTAAVIVMGPHDFGQAAWGTGSFALNDFLTWSFLLAHQENDGWVGSQLRSLVASRLLRDALHVLPLGDAVRTRLQQGAPWYESWLQNADLNSDFWRPVRLDAALDRVEIPVLLIGGWQDVFLNQTLEQYRRIRSRDVNAELIIGPWTHRQAGGEAIRASFGWLARHLADTPDGRPSPVRVFVTGGVGWRDLPDWPPASREMTLYLHPGTALADEPPPADAAPSRFTYDPADPTPTIGGRLLSTAAGYRNDSPLALRDDVLSFTGPVLTEDVDVMGTPYVELTHSTDIPYADVFVRISEVDGKGRSRNVSDGFLRLAASRSSPLRVDLDAIAHRFRAGNRIRLLVAGGSHPRFARNLGTEESMLTSSRFTKATHVVAHGSRGVSRLVLPVASPAR